MAIRFFLQYLITFLILFVTQLPALTRAGGSVSKESLFMLFLYKRSLNFLDMGKNINIEIFLHFIQLINFFFLILPESPSNVKYYITVHKQSSEILN